MKEFISKNISEDYVELYLDDCIEHSDICRCTRCRADVRAIALNHMPPHYVVTEIGDAFMRANFMSSQSKADIQTAIMNAINIVGGNPRHG